MDLLTFLFICFVLLGIAIHVSSRKDVERIKIDGERIKIKEKFKNEVQKIYEGICGDCLDTIENLKNEVSENKIDLNTAIEQLQKKRFLLSELFKTVDQKISTFIEEKKHITYADSGYLSEYNFRQTIKNNSGTILKSNFGYDSTFPFDGLNFQLITLVDRQIAEWKKGNPNTIPVHSVPTPSYLNSFHEKREIFENDVIEDDGVLKIRRRSTHSYNSHKYTIEVTHSGLNLFRVITSPEKYITERKLEIFLNEIKPKWSAKLKTDEAQEVSRNIDEILISAIKTLNHTAPKNGINESKEEAINSFESVLEQSKYPIDFIKKFDLNFNPETNILVVEYQLPVRENIPTLKEVKHIKGELKEYFLSDVAADALFEDVQYKITLRTIHELFVNDIYDILDAISFNGWCSTLNKARGVRDEICILTVQASKDEFMAINLEKVEPKICFKTLKGISGGKLAGLTPIQPIISINKNDRRFVSSYDVVNDIDSSTNLAAMDWEDFEHLIREIFEKEFSTNGSEVKVTQASKDGGVDAIAFDPDPIRGGKIVIQAKRYTNVVGVSAVRDLYGTVMNEGANKGILVTTADYGPDSYEFAKGKPLTLLNGSNLLHLLEKHGHKARINIGEAKSELKSDKLK
ncbi:MAG: restriction endonuclease [Cytophagia bacterium]|nr:MAG: restriction endonuclease [Cytophagales bacterium]TAG40340.1 MAG: restriction endonuclease [Cytophagia bacterium]TAG81899.1 MAG: restriction endonuclease [Cytophagales bacterium]